MYVPETRHIGLDSREMVTANLTKEMIDEGEVLVRALDRRHVSVTDALWYLVPDLDEWKLLIATPLTLSRGPKKAYQAVQSSIKRNKDKIQHLKLGDVGIARPDAPLLGLLRKAVQTGPGISGIRFRNNVINGQLIPDAYIYRLT